MRRLLPLFSFLLLLSTSCDKDSDNITEPVQDYTSFIIYHNEPVNLINSVVGYYAPDGLCLKLAELGDLNKGIYSPEITVDVDTLKYIYVFSDYNRIIKLDTVFILKKNTKNIFEIGRWTAGIAVKKDDIYQYPQSIQ